MVRECERGRGEKAEWKQAVLGNGGQGGTPSWLLPVPAASARVVQTLPVLFLWLGKHRQIDRGLTLGFLLPPHDFQPGISTGPLPPTFPLAATFQDVMSLRP